jgi:hypothetical protein
MIQWDGEKQASLTAVAGLSRALAEFQELRHELAEPWLARLDIG